MKTVRVQAVVDKSKCTGCDTCVHVCPTMAFVPPVARPIDNEMLPPCSASCPVGYDVEGFVSLVQSRKWEDALELLWRVNPLPGVTGRVCHGPCEKACNRAGFDQSVSIMALERAVSDYGAEKHRDPFAFNPKHKEKVAVIGSGPAGLSCAYHLTREGFKATLFEEKAEVGGALRYGIPPYRIPRDILDREVGFIEKSGVDFKPNQKLGANLSLSDLESFDAVYLETGYRKTIDQWGRTSMPRVFSGGDIAAGRGTVAHAIGSGRRGAQAVVAYLLGDSDVEKPPKKRVVSASEMNMEYWDPAPGLIPPRLSPEQAVSGFDETRKTASKKACTTEANRCFHCGVMPEFSPEHCRGCMNCSSRCPQLAISLKELDNPYRVKLEVEEALVEQVREMCIQANLHPESIVCYCTSTRAMEIAAAILKGAKSPEEISRVTGARTGCGVLCIEPIFRLMLAAGLELGNPPQSDLWYATVPTLWEIPRSIIEKYEDRGFRFEEDKAYYEQLMTDGRVCTWGKKEDPRL